MKISRVIAIPLVLLWCALSWAQATRQIAILEIPGEPGFDGMAVVKGMLLMSHAGAGTVDIFDPAKRRLIGNVKGMSDPRGIAVDSAGGRVFISNSGAKNIVVLSLEDWRVKETIPVSGAPTDLLYVPSWNLLIASDRIGQQLMMIDVAGHRELNAAKLPGTPGGMTFDATRSVLYVTIQNLKEVVGLSRQMQMDKKFLLQASQPTGIEYDQKLDRLYVAVRYAVLSLKASTGEELSRVAAAAGIERLWLDGDSRLLYGAAGGSMLVMRADQRLHAIDEVDTDVKGYSVAYDPDRKLVYFPGGRDGQSKLLLFRPPTVNASADVPADAKLQ
jgi:DNA-binding beta-propeller fold protein YncE